MLAAATIELDMVMASALDVAAKLEIVSTGQLLTTDQQTFLTGVLCRAHHSDEVVCLNVSSIDFKSFEEQQVSFIKSAKQMNSSRKYVINRME